MQPGTRRAMLNQIECLVNRIVGTYKEIGAGLGQLVGRRKHQLGNSRPVVGINTFHVSRQGMRMHRNFGMIVSPQHPRTFKRDGPIAESRSLRATSDNANVLRHMTHSGNYVLVCCQTDSLHAKWEGHEFRPAWGMARVHCCAASFSTCCSIVSRS